MVPLPGGWASYAASWIVRARGIIAVEHLAKMVIRPAKASKASRTARGTFAVLAALLLGSARGTDKTRWSHQRWTRPTPWGNKTQGLRGAMTVRPSARAGQSSGSMRDRQRPRVEAADGSAQTPGDRGLFVYNKHLSLSPKTIGCMCMCVCVGVIEWGLL